MDRATPEGSDQPVAPVVLDLTGAQRRELKHALLRAFPDRSTLEQMVDCRLEEDLDAIAGGDDLDAVVWNLIKWADSRGRIQELVAKAREENQGNLELRAFAEALANPVSKAAPRPGPSPSPRLPSAPDRVRAGGRIRTVGLIAAGFGLLHWVLFATMGISNPWIRLLVGPGWEEQILFSLVVLAAGVFLVRFASGMRRAARRRAAANMDV